MFVPIAPARTLITTVDATGTQADKPNIALPPGVVYWRAIAVQAGARVGSMTPTWEFTVPTHPSSAVDSSWDPMFDVDGDGVADFAIGAPATPPNAASSAMQGRVYVFLGGPTLVAIIDAEGMRPGIDQALVPSIATLPGLAAVGNFGASVANAGDVNGDGYADLLVGSSNPGQVVVYFGGPAGLAAGYAVNQVVAPPAASSGFGSLVQTIGDANGDGYADALVTDASGALYLYQGGPSGLATSAAAMWIGGVFAAIVTPGDIDGNGFADLITAVAGTAQVSLYLGTAAGVASHAVGGECVDQSLAERFNRSRPRRYERQMVVPNIGHCVPVAARYAVAVPHHTVPHWAIVHGRNNVRPDSAERDQPALGTSKRAQHDAGREHSAACGCRLVRDGGHRPR